MRRWTAPKTGVAKIKISGHLLLRLMWKRWSWGAYASFVRNRRAWMCRLSVRSSPQVLKKYLATQKSFTPCWFLCETVGFEVLLFTFSQWKGREKNQSPKRGPCNSASYVKKVVLAAVFIFFGQDVPGCAILVLVFPGNPPGNPPKVSKSGFW